MFFFFGNVVLGLFGLEVVFFVMVGVLIIFFIGLEMVLGICFFCDYYEDGGLGSVVLIVFLLVVGVGIFIIILLLKVEFDSISIMIGIVINFLIVFIILCSLDWLVKKLFS